jgi:DNA-binding beta-propeller fold protein YncE
LPLTLAALCLALFVPVAASAAIGPLGSFGGTGPAAGQLNGPEGLAVDTEGNLYVAEYSNNRVSVFTAAGAFVRAFGKGVGGPGIDVCTSSCQAGTIDYPASAGAGALSSPVDVAIASSGRVYVSDSQNSRIDVFTSAGAFLFAFGAEVKPGGGDRCDAGTGCEEGLFSNGAGAFMDVDGIGISGGLLYAADSSNNRVQVFDLEGAFQFAFGEDVGGPGVDVCTIASGCQLAEDEGPNAIDTPSDVAVAPGGNLYVSYNGLESGVAVVSPQGLVLNRFGAALGPGFLEGAVGVAVSPDGLVHVADQVEEDVTTFSAAGSFVSSFPAPDASGIALDCRGSVWTSAYDTGTVVRYGEPGTALPPCPPPVTPILVTVTPSNLFKLGKLKLNKRKGTATLAVVLPFAGKLALKGKGLKKVTRSAKQAATVTLPIAFVGKKKKTLDESGKARAQAKLTFTPAGGTPLTKKKSLTLKKKLGE